MGKEQDTRATVKGIAQWVLGANFSISGEDRVKVDGFARKLLAAADNTDVPVAKLVNAAKGLRTFLAGVMPTAPVSAPVAPAPYAPPPLTPLQEAANWLRDIFKSEGGRIKASDLKSLMKQWEGQLGKENLAATFKRMKKRPDHFIEKDGQDWIWPLHLPAPAPAAPAPPALKPKPAPRPPKATSETAALPTIPDPTAKLRAVQTALDAVNGGAAAQFADEIEPLLSPSVRTHEGGIEPMEHSEAAHYESDLIEILHDKTAELEADAEATTPEGDALIALSKKIAPALNPAIAGVNLEDALEDLRSARSVLSNPLCRGKEKTRAIASLTNAVKQFNQLIYAFNPDTLGWDRYEVGVPRIEKLAKYALKDAKDCASGMLDLPLSGKSSAPMRRPAPTPRPAPAPVAETEAEVRERAAREVEEDRAAYAQKYRDYRDGKRAKFPFPTGEITAEMGEAVREQVDAAMSGEALASSAAPEPAGSREAKIPAPELDLTAFHDPRDAAEGLIQNWPRATSKLESLGRQRELEKLLGNNTPKYWVVMSTAVGLGKIWPSSVVGGSYKNPKKAAIAYISDQYDKAKAKAASAPTAPAPATPQGLPLTDAGFGAANAKYLDSLPSGAKVRILKNVADRYDVSLSEIEDELTGRDAEALYDYIANNDALRMRVYRDFEQERLAEAPVAEAPPALADATQPYYAAFLKVHPELAGQTGARVNTAFMAWMPKRWAEFYKSIGWNPSDRFPDSRQPEFEAWLTQYEPEPEPDVGTQQFRDLMVAGSYGAFTTDRIVDNTFDYLGAEITVGDNHNGTFRVSYWDGAARRPKMLGSFSDAAEAVQAVQRAVHAPTAPVAKAPTTGSPESPLDNASSVTAPDLVGIETSEAHPAEVDDYPYGRKRTEARFWVEKAGKKGVRTVKQTLNPKTRRWNMPKKSTYDFAAGLAEGSDGRVYFVSSYNGERVQVVDGAGNGYGTAKAGDPRFADLMEIAGITRAAQKSIATMRADSRTRMDAAVAAAEAKTKADAAAVTAGTWAQAPMPGPDQFKALRVLKGGYGGMKVYVDGPTPKHVVTVSKIGRGKYSLYEGIRDGAFITTSHGMGSSGSGSPSAQAATWEEAHELADRYYQTGSFNAPAPPPPPSGRSANPAVTGGSNPAIKIKPAMVPVWRLEVTERVRDLSNVEAVAELFRVTEGWPPALPPVFVLDSGEIIDGHHRVLGAQMAGRGEVLAVEVDGEAYHDLLWEQGYDRIEAFEELSGWDYPMSHPAERSANPVHEPEANRLERATRLRINERFNAVGLDGNGRFGRAEDGYVRALDVLSEFGIELGEVVNSHLFSPDDNTLNIRMAFSNPDDSFSPAEIENSLLHLTYHKLNGRRYEVLAYMS